MDYKQLSGGFSAVSGLLQNHPDIQINYDTDVELYTLRGSYTKIQAALEQLLVTQSARNDHMPAPIIELVQKQNSQETHDLSRKSSKETAYVENNFSSQTPEQAKAGGHGNTSVSGYNLGSKNLVALPLSGATTRSDEDCTLIVDSDVFRYTQKNYQKEYKQILSQYGVNAVEMTNEDLTTLFLCVASEAENTRCNWEYLKLVKKNMCSFFRKNESTICRIALSKRSLESVQDMEKAKTTLSAKLPNLLLTEDEWNINVIGSPADVGHAKQFLLEQCNEALEKKEDLASPKSFSPYSSGSSSQSKEQRTPSSGLPTLDSVASKTESEENERKSEGAKKYKLATRFKDSQLGMLGNRPADLVIRGGGSFPPGGSKPLGPVEGFNVGSETAKSACNRVPRAQRFYTVEDGMFESGDAGSSEVAPKKKSSANPHTDANVSSLPFSTPPLPPAGTGATLKRASSFSGSSQPKVESKSKGSQDDSSKSAVRTRPSSSGCQKQVDALGGYSAGLMVSQVMWNYIKEAFGTLVEDLTTDVQVKETRSEGSSDVTVTLRGGSQSDLNLCLNRLQRLVTRVSRDFAVSQLGLSEMGITNPTDENLLACCADVRSRFKEITTHVGKDGLFLVGPHSLCLQVAASLREVFSVDLVPGARDQELSACSMAHWNSNTFSKSDVDQWQQNHNHSQVLLEDGGDASAPRVLGSSQDAKLVNGSVTQPQLRVSPVVREKLKLGDAAEMDGQKKAGNGAVQSKAVPAKYAATQVAHGSLHSITKDSVKQRHVEAAKPLEKPISSLEGSKHTCVCGQRGKSGKRSSRGVEECVACQHLEPKLLGIQGQMSFCKLHISLPGHKKDLAIKVSYRIPDGIQEVRGFIAALATRWWFMGNEPVG